LGGGVAVSNFAVNNSNKAGTVFFGEEAVAVGPYGKLELDSMPSYWTKNIQLVRVTASSLGAGKPLAEAEESSDSNGNDGYDEGVNNG
jgi:hypothetical protein